MVGGTQVAGEKIKEAGEAAKPRLFSESPKRQEVPDGPGAPKSGDGTQQYATSPTPLDHEPRPLVGAGTKPDVIPSLLGRPTRPRQDSHA